MDAGECQVSSQHLLFTPSGWTCISLCFPLNARSFQIMRCGDAIMRCWSSSAVVRITRYIIAFPSSCCCYSSSSPRTPKFTAVQDDVFLERCKIGLHISLQRVYQIWWILSATLLIAKCFLRCVAYVHALSSCALRHASVLPEGFPNLASAYAPPSLWIFGLLFLRCLSSFFLPSFFLP